MSILLATSLPQSLSPIDAFNTAVQQLIGIGPVGSYLAYAITLYLGAALWVRQLRKSLENEWTSLIGWPDSVVVLCAPADPTKATTIQHFKIGELRIFRGKLLLFSFDEAQPVLSFNRFIVNLAERGISYLKHTRLLYAGVTFATMAVCHLVLTLVLILWDNQNLTKADYVPAHQMALALIFLWPACLFYFEHDLVPRWKRDLSEAKRKVDILSTQYAFQDGSIA